MSLLDPEDIFFNHATYIGYKFMTDDLKENLPYWIFKDFAEKNIINCQKDKTFFITTSKNDADLIGDRITSFFKKQQINCVNINCYQVLKFNFKLIENLPKNSIIILSRMREMASWEYQKMIKVLMGWNNSGTLSFQKLYEDGYYPEPSDITLNKDDYTLILLEEKEFTKDGYLERYMEPHIYGDFYLPFDFVNDINNRYGSDSSIMKMF